MTGMDFGDFAPLGYTLDGMIDAVSPQERSALGRKLATDLRAANKKRIDANTTPEGEAMVPRKARASGKMRTKRLRDQLTRAKTRTRKTKMFTRATAPRYLRKQSTEGEAMVGFVGAMARIMRVHHYGLRDTVTRDPASPTVGYPARPLVGITAEDRLALLERIASTLEQSG